MFSNYPFSINNTFTSIIQKDETIFNKVMNLNLNKNNQLIAESYGLKILKICWEDTARCKISSTGPNISDMTLCVNDKNMPIIRKPNFTDITCDVSIDHFKLIIGNEIDIDDDIEVIDPLKSISLKEYLENIDKYTNNKELSSMYLNRDEYILCSSQACILPLENNENNVEFNVNLYNYQTTYTDPAVLVIISSANGTSTQVITQSNQKLYFNDANNAKKFLAKRLSQDRKERDISTNLENNNNNNITDDEKDRNMLYIFQIPLKQQSNSNNKYDYFTCGSNNNNLECFNYMAGAGELGFENNKKTVNGFEKAMISTSEKIQGKFEGTKGMKLVRNEKYPIRCTIQYYNVTDIPEISSLQMKEISKELNSIYDKAKIEGSLVIDSVDRITMINSMDSSTSSSLLPPLIKIG